MSKYLHLLTLAKKTWSGGVEKREFSEIPPSSLVARSASTSGCFPGKLDLKDISKSKITRNDHLLTAFQSIQSSGAHACKE